MPIKEESFRIGCGRYIQGVGYTQKVGEEVLRLGTSPLIIGGKTALGITRDNIEKGVKENCNKYEFIVYTGTCNEESAKDFASLAKEKGYDVIVGVGGGVICDFAKLCGYFARLPVINVPTSSATCASYTPFSIRYTPDGKTVGGLYYENEVGAVIADTAVIANQPIRLFLAGVFDALAKFPEIKQTFNEKVEKYPIGLDYAYFMSKHSFALLNDKTQKCIDDMEKGIVSDDVESIIFTLIAATGTISGIARGTNQSALAHKFYYATKTLFPKSSKSYLHGEIVGIGLILQNHFNGEEENNEHLLMLMRKYNMPSSLENIGIDKTEETFNMYYDIIANSEVVETDDEKKRLKKSLEYFFDIM